MAVAIKNEERQPLRLVVPPVSQEPKRPLLPSEEVMAMLGAIALVVSARVILTLATIGAFTLALISVLNPTIGSIVMTGLYSVLVVGPLVYLALRKG